MGVPNVMLKMWNNIFYENMMGGNSKELKEVSNVLDKMFHISGGLKNYFKYDRYQKLISLKIEKLAHFFETSFFMSREEIF